MNLFFCNTFDDAGRAVLNAEESRHCISVLRMRKGDAIHFVDGAGGFYFAEISEAHSSECVATIIRKQEEYGKREYSLQIAIAPTKNADRFEWFVEKAVEIGIDHIIPLICTHSERKTINADRIQRLILSSCKQSMKAAFPVLHTCISFKDFIHNNNEQTRLIAHCSPSFSRSSIHASYQKGQDAIILIGPEGDFSEEEIRLALDKGYTGLTLGESRLRTETAGVIACAGIYLLNQ